MRPEQARGPEPSRPVVSNRRLSWHIPASRAHCCHNPGMSATSPAPAPEIGRSALLRVIGSSILVALPISLVAMGFLDLVSRAAEMGVADRARRHGLRHAALVVAHPLAAAGRPPGLHCPLSAPWPRWPCPGQWDRRSPHSPGLRARGVPRGAGRPAPGCRPRSGGAAHRDGLRPGRVDLAGGPAVPGRSTRGPHRDGRCRCRDRDRPGQPPDRRHLPGRGRRDHRWAGHHRHPGRAARSRGGSRAVHRPGQQRGHHGPVPATGRAGLRAESGHRRPAVGSPRRHRRRASP